MSNSNILKSFSKIDFGLNKDSFKKPSNVGKGIILSNFILLYGKLSLSLFNF